MGGASRLYYCMLVADRVAGDNYDGSSCHGYVQVHESCEKRQEGKRDGDQQATLDVALASMTLLSWWCLSRYRYGC